MRALSGTRRAVAAGTRCGRELTRLQMARQRRLYGLSDAQMAEVQRVVARDQSIEELLDTGYTVDRVIPLSYGRRRTIGGVAELRMASPIENVRATVPTSCTAPSGETYLLGEVDVTVARAETLSVFVDLGRRRVIDVHFNTGRGSPPIVRFHGGRPPGPCQETRD